MPEDLDAFRSIVERHQAALFGLVRCLGLDGHACEDVVQEAFLEAWRHREGFDPRRGSMRAWLYAIARNRALNALRKRRPVPLAILPERGEDAPEPEAFDRLDRALAALPFEQRAAFVLADVHGLTHEEVARIEGVAPGTIKSRTSRAREALRAALRRQVERTS